MLRFYPIFSVFRHFTIAFYFSTMSIIHPIPPLYNDESRVLILGSFPSVKSREACFFYAHPQNRFWRVLAALFHEEVPQSTAERRAFLLRHLIAVWDTVASCDIVGSSDASMKNAVPNDLTPILAAAPIRAVFCNGSLSHRLYEKHQGKEITLPVFAMPSTSPANATRSLADLTDAWSILLPFLE